MDDGRAWHIFTILPDHKDKGLYAMALDTSARPHELLKLKIKDLKERVIPPIKDPDYTKNHKTGMHFISIHSQWKNR